MDKMPDGNYEMKALSGSPEILAKIPRKPPQEAAYERTGVKRKKSSGLLSPKLIFISAASVIAVALLIFAVIPAVGNMLNGDSDNPIVASSTEKPNENDETAAEKPESAQAAKDGGDSDSGGGLLDGLFSGGGSADDGSIVYITSNKPGRGIFPVGNDLYYSNGPSVRRLRDNTVETVYDAYEIDNSTTDYSIQKILYIKGAFYYWQIDGTLMKAPGGDFSKREVLNDSLEIYDIFSDGENLFALGSATTEGSDSEDVYYRIDLETGEAEALDNIVEPVSFAYDGQFYFEDDMRWKTQGYDEAQMTPLLPEQDIEIISAGDGVMVAFTDDGTIHRLENGELSALIDIQTIIDTANAPDAEFLYRTSLAVDGGYVYFMVGNFAVFEGFMEDGLLRMNLESGELQHIPLQEYEIVGDFAVSNGWITTNLGMFKIEGDAVTGGLVYYYDYNELGVRVDGYEYQQLDISLISY